MNTPVRFLAAAVLAGSCGFASASPVTVAFSGAILSFNQSGSTAGNPGDFFSGTIVFDVAGKPVDVQTGGGTVNAGVTASGGCSVYVNGACTTPTGSVPAPLVLSGTVSTSLGVFSFGPATDGSLTSASVSRFDGAGSGGAQGAKYTLGNFSSRFEATGDGYERTTFNQMIGLDLTAAFGGLFGNPAALDGALDNSALTSGLFNFSSTRIVAQCTSVGLFSCAGGSYAGSGYPQIDLFGAIRTAVVVNPSDAPEPGAVALLLAGGMGLVAARRRGARPRRS